MRFAYKFNCVLFGFLLLLFLTSCKEKEIVKEPPGVFTAPVQIEDVTETKEIVGETVPSEDVNLIARVDGELQKINFREGQLVKKGQVLFEIEKDLYQSKVAATKASLKNAEAIEKHAKIEKSRQGTLVEKDAVSQQAFDNAEVAMEKAQANVELCKAKLEESRINLGYSTIKAPFEGMIGLHNYDVGNIVGPQNGFLANIVKINPIDVEFPINEKIYTSIMLEMSKSIDRRLEFSEFKTVLILPNGHEYRHQGKIKFLNNRVDPSTGTLLMKASFPNPERIILPGQYVRIRMEKKDRQNSLVIPNSIVQLDKNGNFVFVVDKNNIVSKRRITLGKNILNKVVVKSGLSEGEQIVIEGVQKVHSGMKVNPILKKEK
jgi:membrane fusion protein, multidrug efflux system